ncbi:MAG: four helix bundle protein [Crocinitomicaceae bacterium]
MHNYKNLRIWSEAMDVATEVYKITREFPKEEIYGLTSQLRRAAVSVPSNIAEGSGRTTDKDFKNFLSFSLGSAFETTTQLELACRLEYCEREEINELLSKTESLQKQITAFRNKLN